MRTWRHAAAIAVVTAGLLAPAAQAAPVPGAPDCPVLPANNIWRADVSRLPVHARSAQYVASIGLEAGLKADFGSGTWDGGPIGIPYTTVAGTQQRVPVTFEYDDESDHPPGGYPIPRHAPIEGGPSSDGDRHILVVDRDACVLYELFAAYPSGDGSWRAGSGAVFDLRSNALRPRTWTSADAAGLPILPGLVRYDEVASGRIDHAIRVTAPRTQDAFVWPARHQAGIDDASLPPMGLRLRLKASFDISGFPAHDRVILRALKTYGLILADNGSPWFMSGVPDERWDNDVLHMLRDVPGSAFEAVDTSSLMIDPDSGAARSLLSRYRIAGADRVGTAIALSRRAYPRSAPAVALTGSHSSATAVAAGPLATAARGPLLLTPSDHLPAEVRRELVRLDVGTVFVVGGARAVSPAVLAEVEALPGVRAVRVAGRNRYATAAAAARRAAAHWHRVGSATAGRHVLVALGDHADPNRAWPDALAAGTLAGHARRPLLLTAPDHVPRATAAAMDALGTRVVTVIGGPAAISQSTARALARGRDLRRIGGVDRADTARLVALASARAGANGRTVLIATGDSYADALAAGPAVFARDGVLLLTTRDALSPPTRRYLGARAGTLRWLRVAGGRAAISDATLAAALEVARY